MAEHDPGKTPLACLLDCSAIEGTRAPAGLLSLGLAGGELVTVQLSLDELARLAGDALCVLAALGHEPARVPAQLYAVGMQHALPPIGSAKALMPPHELLPPSSRRARPRRPQRPTRPRKPFSRSSGYFLKVRFEQEATHRRIAILGGWHVNLRVHRPRCKQPDRKLMRLRWKMLVCGRPRFRDFFVLLPPDAEQSREVQFISSFVEGIRLTPEHLQQLAGCLRDDEVRIGELRIRCWPLSAIMEQTGRMVFRAGCTANQWEKQL